MKFISGSANLVGTSLLISVVLLASTAHAQQKSLTIEELEQYIQEQKATLEEVKANRDETEKKAQEVRDALEAQEARRVLLEEELDMLCTEQETLKPGTYDECKASGDS